MDQDQAGAGPGEENARLRRELEAAREDAARFRAILESAADYAILTIDPDLRVTGWNKGAENLLGWSEAEALGMDGRLTFTPEDRERGEPEAERDRAAAEGRAGNERWHRRKDGGRFWGSGVLVPLRGRRAGLPQGDARPHRPARGRRAAGAAAARAVAPGQELARGGAAPWPARAASAPRTWPGFLDDFEGRLLALAAAHDLLSDNGWLGAPLAALVRRALAPHDGGAGSGSGSRTWRSCRRRRRTWSWCCTSWRRTRSSTGRSRPRAGR